MRYNMQNVFSYFFSDKNGYKFRYKNNKDLPLNYIRLQIHNSLDLGWEKQDIVLITNFEFEHMDIKANLWTDINNWSAFANKMPSVHSMIKSGVINNDFWFHDADCYQLQPFKFPDVGNGCGFTRHAPGRNKPQGGSSFWSKDSYDIIQALSDGVKLFKAKKEESHFPCYFEKGYRESRLKKYSNVKYAKRPEFYNHIDKYFGVYGDRFKWLNWTYGLFRVHDFSRKYPKTEKPVKIAHFKAEVKNCWDCFVEGKNKCNAKVVDNRLLKLFPKYSLTPKL